MTIKEADVKLFKPVQGRSLFASGGRVPGPRFAIDGKGGLVVTFAGDLDRVPAVMLGPPAPPPSPDDRVKLAAQLAAAGFRSRKEIIAEAEAEGEIGDGGETPGASALVGEVEQLLAIELRTELLKVLQDVGPRVLARLHVCRGCGELFLAKRRGGTVKWCPACRK